MTGRTVSVMAVGVCLAVGIGVWIGTAARLRPMTNMSAYNTQLATDPSADIASDKSNISVSQSLQPATAATPATDKGRARGRATSRRTGVLISPALAKHVRPLLRNGANVTVAADGFSSAAEFVTVARAAHNTGVPFMLLKHRVVTEGRSLATAIESSKPELNGRLEAQRASAEARVDVAYIAS